MDEGIIITAGLQVTLAPRASVRDDEIFVSREDAPALIEKIQALLLPKDEIKPDIPQAKPATDDWDSTQNT